MSRSYEIMISLLRDSKCRIKFASGIIRFSNNMYISLKRIVEKQSRVCCIFIKLVHCNNVIYYSQLCRGSLERVFHLFFQSTTGNFDWSDNNSDGTAIYSYYTQTSSGTTFSGVLEDFRQYVRTYSTSITYDHAMAISG